MVKYAPATQLSILRIDILQVLSRHGCYRPQVARTTLDDKFPKVLMRAFFPTQFSEQERQICEREISKLINKPVLLRNQHEASKDEIQMLAKFEPL
jgi:hypothetical protein